MKWELLLAMSSARATFNRASYGEILKAYRWLNKTNHIDAWREPYNLLNKKLSLISEMQGVKIGKLMSCFCNNTKTNRHIELNILESLFHGATNVDMFTILYAFT